MSAQEEVRETRRVRVFGPDLRRSIEAGHVTRLDEVLSHPDQRWEIRTFRHGHLVGPALTESEIADWQNRHPQSPLPADLRALLTRLDGIHLWADLDRGKAYWGVLPLAQWEDTVHDVGAVAISYHDNGDYFLVLDTTTAEYRWHDHEDFDNPTLVATNVPELLDWLWREAARLAPEAARR